MIPAPCSWFACSSSGLLAALVPEHAWAHLVCADCWLQYQDRLQQQLDALCSLPGPLLAASSVYLLLGPSCHRPREAYHLQLVPSNAHCRDSPAAWEAAGELERSCCTCSVVGGSHARHTGLMCSRSSRVFMVVCSCKALAPTHAGKGHIAVAGTMDTANCCCRYPGGAHVCSAGGAHAPQPALHPPAGAAAAGSSAVGPSAR